MFNNIMPNIFCFVFTHRKLHLPEKALQIAQERNFELQGYAFDAKREDVRLPRIVRVGAIQNHIIAPTTSSISEQVRSTQLAYSIKIN